MASVITRFLPREQSFFILFNQVAANICEGARALSGLFQNFDDRFARAGAIKELEHKGDNFTHEIFTQLNQTFVTPFDREDIHALTNKLDDVLDLIDAAAGRIVNYRADTLHAGATELGDILVRATKEIKAAVSHLEKPNGILEHCIEINRLENEGDAIVRQAIGRLFDEEKDPVELIKWKEILEVLEIAIDKCEDVANILESVVLKNA